MFCSQTIGAFLPVAINGDVTGAFQLILSQATKHVTVADSLQHLERFLLAHQPIFRVRINRRDGAIRLFAFLSSGRKFTRWNSLVLLILIA
jgi:hypothetical protein